VPKEGKKKPPHLYGVGPAMRVGRGEGKRRKEFGLGETKDLEALAATTARWQEMRVQQKLAQQPVCRWCGERGHKRSSVCPTRFDIGSAAYENVKERVEKPEGQRPRGY
jgi:hypothetical protein